MYQVPAWRQAGEVQSTELEIHWKYDRNRLRCACLPQALAALQPAPQNYGAPNPSAAADSYNLLLLDT
jgi:hypothetical protein